MIMKKTKKKQKQKQQKTKNLISESYIQQS